MQITITNENGNVVFNGEADDFLFQQDNDTELELMLNALDYANVSEVYYGELCIEKVLELIYWQVLIFVLYSLYTNQSGGSQNEK